MEISSINGVAQSRVSAFLKKNIWMKDKGDDKLVAVFQEFIAAFKDVPFFSLELSFESKEILADFITLQGYMLKAWFDGNNYLSLESIKTLDDLAYLVDREETLIAAKGQLSDAQISDLWSSFYANVWLALWTRYKLTCRRAKRNKEALTRD